MSTTDTIKEELAKVDPRHVAAWLRRLEEHNDNPSEEQARRLAWVAGPIKSDAMAWVYGL